MEVSHIGNLHVFSVLVLLHVSLMPLFLMVHSHLRSRKRLRISSLIGYIVPFGIIRASDFSTAAGLMVHSIGKQPSVSVNIANTITG